MDMMREDTRTHVDLGATVSYVDDLVRLAEGIRTNNVTTGSASGDLALNFAVENDCLREIEPIKNFWHTVDEELKDGRGELIIATNYRNFGRFIVGRITNDNVGLLTEYGEPIFPVKDNVLAVDYSVNATPRHSKSLGLSAGYKLKDHKIPRSHIKHPDALHGGSPTVERPFSESVCSISIGDEQVQKFLGYEFIHAREITSKKSLSELAIKVSKRTFVVNPDEVFRFLDSTL